MRSAQSTEQLDRDQAEAPEPESRPPTVRPRTVRNVTCVLEVSARPGVRLESLTTSVIAPMPGGIRHVVNGTGEAVDGAAPDSEVFGRAAVTRLRPRPER